MRSRSVVGHLAAPLFDLDQFTTFSHVVNSYLFHPVVQRLIASHRTEFYRPMRQ